MTTTTAPFDPHGAALADISNSLAYTILDDLEGAGVLSSDDTIAFKTRYASLHEVVLETYEHEKVLLAKAKQMNLDWIDRKKRLEKKLADRGEMCDRIQELRAQLEQHEAEVTRLEEKGSLCTYELEELDRTKVDMADEMQAKRDEAEALTMPIIERLSSTIKQIQC